MKRPSILWLLALCTFALSTFYSCESFTTGQNFASSTASEVKRNNEVTTILPDDTPDEFNESSTTPRRSPLETSGALVFHADSTTKAIIGTDDIVLHYEAPTDSIAKVLGTDDIVLHIVEPSDNVTFDIEVTDTIRTLTIEEENEAPNGPTSEPDYIFILDDSFVILDYKKMQILGTRMNAAEETTKGIWEFPLPKIHQMRIPNEIDTEEARQLWVYIAKEAERDL